MAKSKPIGVRFDLDKLEMIQKEQNLTSVQQVVNYFMDNYKSEEVKKSDLFKNMPFCDTGFSSSTFKSKNNAITIENKTKPPDGLKGIELLIWKSENWK